jgi:hypothetical protein
MSDAAPPPMTPDAPGLWWRTRLASRATGTAWEWFVVEVFEWADPPGLRTASGLNSDLLPEIKWGGRAVPPAIDPRPE